MLKSRVSHFNLSEKLGNPQYVLFSEKYYIDKILIDFDNNRYEAEFLDNLSSFCLGNQIETIVKGDIRNMPNFTCYLKELDTIKLNEKEVKVKKMKAKKGK